MIIIVSINNDRYYLLFPVHFINLFIIIIIIVIIIIVIIITITITITITINVITIKSSLSRDTRNL